METDRTIDKYTDIKIGKEILLNGYTYRITRVTDMVFDIINTTTGKVHCRSIDYFRRLSK